MTKTPTILVVGTGNVAWHLCNAFKDSNCKIKGIVGRNTSELDSFSRQFNIESFGFHDFPNSEVILIAVSDDKINKVSEIFKASNALVVHTSGTKSIAELCGEIKNKGVFYPFQTFSKNKPLNYKSTPIFIETEKPENTNFMKTLAGEISSKVHDLDSTSRKELHLAGVLSNNFVNALIGEATSLLTKNNIPTEVMWPLLEETIAKAKSLGAKDAQTGPAKRGDSKSIEAHLELLKSNDQLKKLYSIMSNLIQERHS